MTNDGSRGGHYWRCRACRRLCRDDACACGEVLAVVVALPNNQQWTAAAPPRSSRVMLAPPAHARPTVVVASQLWRINDMVQQLPNRWGDSNRQIMAILQGLEADVLSLQEATRQLRAGGARAPSLFSDNDEGRQRMAEAAATMSVAGAVTAVAVSHSLGSDEALSAAMRAAAMMQPPPADAYEVAMLDTLDATQQRMSASMARLEESTRVLQDLLNAHHHRHWPTAQYVLDALPRITVSSPCSSSSGAVQHDDICGICAEAVETNHVLLQLPCRHAFHQACVLPWLQTHNTCPYCRHALTPATTDNQ